MLVSVTIMQTQVPAMKIVTNWFIKLKSKELAIRATPQTKQTPI